MSDVREDIYGGDLTHLRSRAFDAREDDHKAAALAGRNPHAPLMCSYIKI